MTLDYDSFLKWALIKEPSLKIIEPLSDPNPDGFYNDKDINRSCGISEYTYQQTTIAFEEALNRCASLKRYMRENNYINLIFNYALHISIVSSSFAVKKDENGDIWNEPTEALQKLYVQYGVYDSTAGIITSSSSGGSSASSALPKSVSEGDLETSWLMSTPYGVYAEMYFEQMNGIII